MNEVEETLRVLNVQIGEYKRILKSSNNKELKKIYEHKLNESIQVKKEIMDKYNIPYTKEDDNL